MNVNTANVKDRREVHYESYQDLLAEAEQLLGGDVRTLGNWSLGQVLKHLAETMHASIDGAPYRVGLLRRAIGRLLLRDRYLNRGMPPGNQLPASARETLVPAPTSGEEGLAALRRAIYRLAPKPTVPRIP